MFRHAAALLVVAFASAPVSAAQPSARGQRHFEDATGDLPSEPVTAVALDPSTSESLYAGLDGFVFKSDDGGEAWRPILSFPRGTALDDTDSDLADETSGGAQESNDLPDGSIDGARTVPITDAALITGAARSISDEDLPDGDPAAGLDATVDPTIETAVFARAGAGVRSLVIVPGSAQVMYVATPRGLYRTINRGASFERIVIAGGVRANDVRDVAVDPARPSRLYIATAAGLLISRDGGASFMRARGRVGAVPALCATAELLTSSNSSNKVGADVAVLVGTEHGLFRSNDGGDDFLEVLLRGLPPFFGVASVAIAVDSGTFYAGTSEGLFVGERNAALLERYSGVPQTLVQAILPDPQRPRTIAIGTHSRGVLLSYDAGNTIDEGAEQVPAAEVFALARARLDNDAIIVATDRGLFRSRPGSGVKLSGSALDKLRARWAQEPGLNQTARTALAYNRLGDSDLHDMAARAGLAKLLPTLDARFDVTSGRTIRSDRFLLRAGDDLPLGLDPDNDEVDLFGNIGAFVIQPAEGLRHLFFVRLTWDLDQVIFNEDVLSVRSEVPQWYAAERQVIERVREAWSARRRLMTEAAVGDGPSSQVAALNDARRFVRLQELTAQLDGVTGGAFSHGTLEDSR